jgi:lipid-A-disaccharide synthase
MKCLLPIAATISPDSIQSAIDQSPLEIIIYSEDIYRALSICDLALVASGTATLETAIMGVPMIIAYRVSPISFWIGKLVIKVKHVGLVNLVAGEEVAPELIQDKVTAQNLADKALSILRNKKLKTEIINKFDIIKEKLGSQGASQRTAKIALDMMQKG